MHEQKPQRFHVNADAVRFELALSKKVRLVGTDVIEPKLVWRAVKMPGELRHGVKVDSSCILTVISTLEFVEHHLRMRVMGTSCDPQNTASD